VPLPPTTLSFTAPSRFNSSLTSALPVTICDSSFAVFSPQLPGFFFLISTFLGFPHPGKMAWFPTFIGSNHPFPSVCVAGLVHV